MSIQPPLVQEAVHRRTTTSATRFDDSLHTQPFKDCCHRQPWLALTQLKDCLCYVRMQRTKLASVAAALPLQAAKASPAIPIIPILEGTRRKKASLPLQSRSSFDTLAEGVSLVPALFNPTDRTVSQQGPPA